MNSNLHKRITGFSTGLGCSAKVKSCSAETLQQLEKGCKKFFEVFRKNMPERYRLQEINSSDSWIQTWAIT